MTMVAKQFGRVGASQPEPFGGDHGRGSDPFKRWLRQGLLEGADQTRRPAGHDLHEPLPEVWLRLLDRLPPSG